MQVISRLVVGGLLAVLFVRLSAPASAQGVKVDSETFGGLEARALGPAVMSGRLAALDAVEGDRLTIYVGSAGGGVWKSVDGGLQFKSNALDVSRPGGAHEFEAERFADLFATNPGIASLVPISRGVVSRAAIQREGEGGGLLSGLADPAIDAIVGRVRDAGTLLATSRQRQRLDRATGDPVDRAVRARDPGVVPRAHPRAPAGGVRLPPASGRPCRGWRGRRG